MIVLVALLAFIAILAMAIQGVGYRGLYFAAAVLALFVGMFFVLMTPSTLAVAAATDPAERAGAEFLFNNGPGVAGACFAVALASLVGGVAFRGRPVP